MKGILQTTVDNPYEYARSLKDAGKKVIGFFCAYTPEEIIHASGAHPMRLFGATKDISLADTHLQSYCCSLVKGGLEEGLSGRLDFLYGAVFPHTCDSMQRLSDIWRLNTNFKFFADIVLPVKLNTASAREYMRDVIEKFRRDLERGLEIKISDDDLKNAIKKYNRIRGYLKNIYDIRSGNPELLTGSQLYKIMKASMIIDRDILLEELPLVIGEIKQGKFKKENKNQKRIIVTGSICSHPDVYTLIEDAGGTIIWDDLCTGSRYFEGQISENGDPIEAITNRYFERPVCPAKHVSLTSRAENILKMAKKNNADGIIFLLLKFCDPHSFDYPYIKEYLDKENIPSSLVEIEDNSISEGQLRTRFETFVEML